MTALRASCGASLTRVELSGLTSTSISIASGRISHRASRTSRRPSTRKVVVGAVASTPWIGDWSARENDQPTVYDGPPLRWFNEPAGTSHGGTQQTYPSIGDWAAETMASYRGPPLRWFNDTHMGSTLAPSSMAAPASSEWIADWAAEGMASQRLLAPPPSEPLEEALPVPGRVHQLTSLEQLETLLVQSSALIVLDCHTPACGPCKLMHPVFAANAQRFHNAIFLSVNTEQDEETRGIASRLGVSSLPAFFAFRDMKLVGRCRGAQVDVLAKMLVDNTVQGEAGYVLPCFRKRKANVRGGGPRSASILR